MICISKLYTAFIYIVGREVTELEHIFNFKNMIRSIMNNVSLGGLVTGLHEELSHINQIRIQRIEWRCEGRKPEMRKGSAAKIFRRQKCHRETGSYERRTSGPVERKKKTLLTKNA